jgi:hypothetical protein
VAVVALGTGRKATSHDERSGGWNGNSVSLEDGELRLIQRGLRQVVESFDGVDRESCGQTPVPNTYPGVTIFAYPTDLQTAVLLLESEKGSKVYFVPDSNRRASKDTHGECQSVAFRSYPLLNPFAKDGTKGKIGFSALDLLQETSHEE